MCGPTALAAASLAIGVASSGVQYMGQAQAAASQADYQNRLAIQREEQRQQNAEAAIDAYIKQTEDEGIRVQQQREAAAVEHQDVARRRLEAQGEARASSEAAGMSFDMLMRDFERSELRHRNVLTRQSELDTDESQRRIAGYAATAQDRINSVTPYTPQPVQSPSILGAGLQMIGTGIDVFNTYTTWNPETNSYDWG